MEDEDGKLFVGGLSRETSEETLKEHFSKYGEVKDCQVMKDWVIGRSRGFGFVTFVHPSDVIQALHDRHPTIDGRAVDVKAARPRGERAPQNQNVFFSLSNQGYSKITCNGNCNDQFKTKKIFVGGLPATLTNEEFKKYFEGFGKVEDVVVMYDRNSGRPRGFGFITFDSEEAVDNILQMQRSRFHELGNKKVEVKRAMPKDRMNEKIYTYDTNNTGLGFARNFILSGSGGYLPYVPYGYYDYGVNPYGSGAYNDGLGYCYYQSSLSYATPVFNSTYTGRWNHTNGWDSGLANVNEIGNQKRADTNTGPRDSGALFNSTYTRRGIDTNGRENGLVDVIDDNDLGAATASLNKSLNLENGGESKVPVPPRFDDLSVGNNNVGNQNRADADSSPRDSSDQEKMTDVSDSRANGDDGHAEITAVAHLSCSTEALILESNRSDNRKRPTGQSCP